jgi:ABC-2 type transport system ATP-binding protein
LAAWPGIRKKFYLSVALVQISKYMKSNQEFAVNVTNLHKVFYSIRGFWRQHKHPIVAVDDISFEIKKGELFGIVGPNGAGKTTTIKMLSTLLLPTSGNASILGCDILRDTDEIRRRIGFTFGGNKGLYGRLSALDNLRYFAELYKIDPDLIGKRIDELLDVVGLAGREHDRVETYSSGMQQRLHLARALLHDPELIFLDEPTVGIDPVGAREIRQLVKVFVERGKTILLTSHYMYEVEELCDRIAVVNQGRIIALDTPAALKAGFQGDCVIVIQAPNGKQSVQGLLDSLQTQLTKVHVSGDSLSLYTKNPSVVLDGLTPLLKEKIVANIEVRNASLEDVYVNIVKTQKT